MTTEAGRAEQLPDGAVLVHIGPHKTGTTAVQAALWGARDELRRQGVRLAGGSRNPASAVRAITGQVSPYADDGRVPPMWRWRRLAGEVRRARLGRVVVSSEFFAWAAPQAIARIVDELGSDRVRIVVTLRPLARIIPSMWQQNVQAGTTATLDDWLRLVLRKTDGAPRNPFWTLERHDELIDRWAAVVGPHRVHAVVADERDHGFVLRAFETLLGLAAGSLAAQPDFANRSLTLPEVEAVRAFNVAFQAEHLPRGLHARLMRFGAAQELKRRVPPPDEARVAFPAWAADEVAGIQRSIIEGIRRSGIVVIGDLDQLAQSVAGRAGEFPEVPVPASVAAALGMGLLVASGEARRGRRRIGRPHIAEPIEIAGVPTYQVAAVLVLRAWRRVGRIVDTFLVRVRIRRGPGPQE